MLASKLKYHMKGWKNAVIVFILFAFLPLGIEIIYYKYSDIKNFVDIQKLDFQDYNKGDKTQLLLSYRNSKVDTIGDFYYKIFCNGKTNLHWNYNTLGILLHKTDGLKVIEVDMPTRGLDKGECLIQSKIIINLNKYKREIYLEDDFIVK